MKEEVSCLTGQRAKRSIAVLTETQIIGGNSLAVFNINKGPLKSCCSYDGCTTLLSGNL